MKTKKTPEELSDTDRFRLMLAKVTPHPSPIEEDDTAKYLWAVFGSLLVGISGVAAILWLRPDFDILVVAGIIFAFLTPTTTSILALMKGQETNKQVKETHLSVNSRLDAFIESTAAVARAEGVQEGRDKADARTDELSEAKK